MDCQFVREELLAQIAAPVEEQAITVAGIDTAYLATGKGQPLLLLHGATAGGALSWYPLLSTLAKRFRVIVPDCPGYGNSTMRPIDHTIPRFMQWLDAFLTTVQIDKATVMGTSQGGALAMRYALFAPTRVAKLVLINTAGLSSRMSPRIALFAAGNFLLSRCSTQLLQKFFEQLFLFQHNPHTLRLQLYRRYTRAVALSPAFQQVSWLQRTIQLNRPLQLRELQQIQQPTLLLASAKDRLFPPKVAREASAYIPQVQFHVVPQTGHAAFLE
ncbi:MAG: alpha/beta hydrolase, partial [Caldilineaceae bacterium]|nr:alpha/beta hydrolase [Caldilineaceae bacterium]